jgi:mannose-6-phosphate isomerase
VAETLIGPEDTPCFSMERYCLNGGSITLEAPASIWICVEGDGFVEAEGFQRSIKTGDYFFLPAAAAGKCSIFSEKSAKIVCCMGGK